jgi:hypothetical protein
MEGQDQPAFYPLVERAKCRLKSVERFTGSGPLWGEVAFDGEYVASGFVEARDEQTRKYKPRSEQSEIYLRIVQSDDGEGTLPLDFKDRGDLAGGVAHPTMDVVAISRQLGPINGGQTAPTLSRQMTAADTPMPPDAPAKPSAGIVPLLDRINRFKDSINIVPKGKFLGIMELSDLLEKFLGVNLHPKLNELIEYAAASAGTAATGTLTEVRSLLTKALIAPAEKAVAEVEKAWAELAKKQLNIGSTRTPAITEVYPQIGTDLAGLHRLLLDAQNPSTDDISFFAELAAIHEAARRLGRSIDNIARDPLAAAATAQLDVFREFSRPIDEIRRRIDRLKELKFATILYETIEPEAKKLVLAKLQEIAKVDVAKLDEKPPPLGVTQVNDPIVRALDKAWLSKKPTIAALAELPKELVKALQEEANSDSLLDGPAKDSINELIKWLSDQIKILQPAVDSLNRLEKELRLKLGSVEAKYRKKLVKLQEDTERARRRAEQAMLEILLLPQVTTAISLAIEIKTAFNENIFTPPLDQEKLEKLINIVAPSLTALAVLGGADQAAAKLLNGAGPLCGQVARATKAGIAAVLPEPGTLTRSSPKVKPISDAIDSVSAALPAADKTKFDATVADLLAKLRGLDEAIVSVAKTVGDWAAVPNCTTAPASLGEQLRKVVQQQRVFVLALRQLINDVADLIEQQLKKDLDQGSRKVVYEEINLVNKLIDESGALSLVVATKELLEQFAAQLKSVSDSIRPVVPSVANALDLLAEDLQNRLDLEMQENELASLRDKIVRLKTALEGQTLSSQDTVDELKSAIKAAKQEFSIQQELVVRRVNQALSARLYDLISPPAAVALEWATKLLDSFGGKVGENLDDKPLGVLFGALDAAVEQRRKLNELIEEKSGDVIKRILDTLADDIGAVPANPTASRRAYLFLVEPKANLTEDALVEERRLAQEAKANWPTNRALALVRLTELSDAWRKPALVVLVQRFNGLSAATLRAVLVDALDLRALRRELDRIVRELVPSKAILGYTLSTPVRKFGLPGIGDIFLPLKDTKIDIRMQAIIDLQKPTAPSARVDGTMGPFGICLFGNFDVVTLNFHGLEFRSGGGRKSGFDIRFGDFVVGSKAKFLKQLEPFISPKGGLPPVRPMRDKPGIEASYGINLGSFGVGYLSFSNVSLNAGARLPFGAREEAEFLISIGRADAPFLISSTVFGGGGYLALLANGKGFIGLETSFDYGGVFAFGFGPLTGAGQITLGMYFRAARGSPARLGMTFMARGAANIACFSICAALMVRLTYSGGKMDGVASYTFSFSYGIDDIDFEFDVYVSQGGSAGAASPTGFLDLPGMPAPTRFAGASGDPLDAFAAALPPTKPAVCEMTGPTLSVKTPSPKSDWRSYHSLFDTSLDPPMVKV